MATVVLKAAGSAIGGLFGPLGAAIGGALGGMAGASIDQALLSKPTKREGARLESMKLLGSVEGSVIPRLFGTMRVGGQIIWATALDEQKSTRTVGPKGARQTTTEYSYRANFAVGLCEGEVAAVRRIWADGKILDLSSLVWRLHTGSETQTPDPLIIAKEGAAEAPAYRGTAYVVFEGMLLEDYGNRIPQLTFEVSAPLGGFERALRAVSLIPGTGEFVYEDRVVTHYPGEGSAERVNRHVDGDAADFVVSVEDLLATCPNIARVSLVVGWFGDDLRAASCRIEPRAERAVKTTTPAVWQVAGVSRDAATLVSTLPDGRASYGGTPSDESVVRAILYLKSRGVAVTLYPFIMMDIPAGNTLPNPYGGTGQPAFPWRGRITVDPAPGKPGTVDGTGAAATQIAAFFGTATPAQFAAVGGAVAYSGPVQWTYRRMVLHYATLAGLAGGVESFVLGSELIGLTRARSASGVYPAVAQLVSLAADVKSKIGAGTRLVYGADWTEYGAHVLSGGAEIRFPLDPLFASANIDAVALDWYAPMADWRDDNTHLDAATARSIYGRGYLSANIAGGEGFDWYYASEGDRIAQIRTPITDAAYGKSWVFRQKDLIGWWSNPHKERVGGVELANTTAWIPQSKPIWLLEFGCPAIDKGANRPSAFPDAKSSESELPPFSNGASDPLMMNRVLEALIDRFDPLRPAFVSAANPVSTVTGQRMVDASRLYVWAWDARPYPAFPHATDAWGDSENYLQGHWLNGRADLVTLDRLIARLASEPGVTVDTTALAGVVTGAAMDRVASARDAIEPIAQVMTFSATDRAGTLVFRHAEGGVVTAISPDSLVIEEGSRDDVALERSRAQESELPRVVTVAFADPEDEHRSAVETSRRLDTESRHETRVETGLAMTRSEAARRAEILLQDSWIARETANFSLSRTYLGLETGDLVSLIVDGRSRLHRLEKITERGGSRAFEVRRLEPAVFNHRHAEAATRTFRAAEPEVAPKVVLLDLPTRPVQDGVLQWIAATAKPWPGPLIVWRSTTGTSFEPFATISRPATIGRLMGALPVGPIGRFDRANSVTIALDGMGDLVSRPEAAVLDGANTLAIQRPDNSLEILKFVRATLLAPGQFRIDGLLRGEDGSDGAMATLPPGSQVVLLDDAVIPLLRNTDDVGRSFTWRVGSSRLEVADAAMTERCPT